MSSANILEEFKKIVDNSLNTHTDQTLAPMMADLSLQVAGLNAKIDDLMLTQPKKATAKAPRAKNPEVKKTPAKAADKKSSIENKILAKYIDDIEFRQRHTNEEIKKNIEERMKYVKVTPNTKGWSKQEAIAFKDYIVAHKTDEQIAPIYDEIAKELGCDDEQQQVDPTE